MNDINLVDTIILLLLSVIFIDCTYLTIMKLKQRTLKVARGSILLDTSAIMDGRIVDVAKSGVITAEIIIPRSVINEMQLLADKSDHEKRVRARKGLDNIRVLQKLEQVSVAIVNDGQVGSGGVDERLLELASRYDASIATTDYNLNKVAKVINITVINVNELAQMLRAQHFPGDVVEIELLQEGANRDQAVGYLEDGTMVVVEDAKTQIGDIVKVEITRSLQTEAGRMMFAKKCLAAKSSAKKTINSKLANNLNQSKNKAKTAVSKRIKAANVFHSDQLKLANNKKTLNKSIKATKPKRRVSSQKAEASMVRLANSKKDS